MTGLDLLTRKSYDECDCGLDLSTASSAEYPLMSSYRVRLKSFFTCHWPVGLKQKPEHMAASGFFYQGSGDMVI